MEFPEMEQKIDKKVLVFNIVAFELGWENSHILEQDTCHWQSISFQATLRFKISVSEAYSETSSLWVMENIIKVLSWRFYKSFRPFNMLTVKGCSKTVFFREWSNQIFDSL